MIIEEQRQEVLVGGAKSVDAFTIKASAKAFQILSSNLYSNPLGSMIRELSTNAYDAHIMVGKKDEPFEIKLPNGLDPTFRIRDFGPGLSHEDIMTVYTTFFESTKTNSNDVVGCLGLGSKSPFGVADSFTVTSYFQGEKTIYSSFLDDNRIPSIALFHKEPTNEPNGLEIEIAIKEKDFGIFDREVNEQLKYFKVKPIVKGNNSFEWTSSQTEILFGGSNWSITTESHGRPRAIQGQIAYPINIRDMGSVFDSASEIIKTILQKSLLFTVNIGDLNIAPSREALSYDNRTCNKIIDMAQKVLDELPSKIKEALQEAPTEYQARLLYADFMQQLGISGYYKQTPIAAYLEQSGTILWNGKDVSTKNILVPQSKFDSVVELYKYKVLKFKKSIKTTSIEYDAPVWKFEAKDFDYIRFVHMKDTDKNVEARAKAFFNNCNRYSQIFIIKTSITTEQLAEQLGLTVDDIVIAENIPKIKRLTPQERQEKTTAIPVQLYRYGYWNKTDQWATKHVDDLNELQGFFVNLDRYDVSDSNGKTYHDLKGVVAGAIDLELIDADHKIYGLRLRTRKKPHKLVDLFEFIKTKLAQSNIGPKINISSNSNKIVTQLISYNKDLVAINQLIDDSSPMKAVLQALIINNDKKMSYNASKLLDIMNVERTVQDTTEHIDHIDQLYPMLKYISYDTSPNEIASYIIQIDTLAQTNHGILPVV